MTIYGKHHVDIMIFNLETRGWMNVNGNIQGSGMTLARV